LEANSSPLLLEIPSILVTDLSHEDGRGIDEPGSALFGRHQPIELSPIFDRMAFRLNRVVPFQELAVYEPADDGREFFLVKGYGKTNPKIGMIQ